MCCGMVTPRRMENLRPYLKTKLQTAEHRSMALWVINRSGVERNLMVLNLRTLLLRNLNVGLSLVTALEKYYEQRYAVNHISRYDPHTSFAATIWAPRVFQGSETFPRNLSGSCKGSNQAWG